MKLITFICLGIAVVATLVFSLIYENEAEKPFREFERRSKIWNSYYDAEKELKHQFARRTISSDEYEQGLVKIYEDLDGRLPMPSPPEGYEIQFNSDLQIYRAIGPDGSMSENTDFYRKAVGLAWEMNRKDKKIETAMNGGWATVETGRD